MTTRAQVIIAAQGTQGPPGLRWRGVYDPTAAYTVRDLVRDNDNNIIYVVIADVAANSNYLLTNPVYFEVFSIQVARAPGMQWRGEFDPTIDYAARDIVRDPNTNSVYYFKVDVSRNTNPDLDDPAIADLFLQGLEVSYNDVAALNALSPYSTDLQTLSPYAQEIGTAAGIASEIALTAENIGTINTVATAVSGGASSEVFTVATNIADVNTVAAALNTAGGVLYTAGSNATAAAGSATAAAGSATAALASEVAAASSESNAATSESLAQVYFEDAQKLAVHPQDTQYILSDATQGYSALHYAQEALAAAAEINSKFIGTYTTATLPTSGVQEGAILYNENINRLMLWDGTEWLLGLEGEQGPAGAGIQSVSYDAFTDTLSITYDDPGTATARDPRIGSEDIDFGSQKIAFSNFYNTLGALPSAAIYPGMFAVAADTGKPYFSYAGSWYELTFNATPARTD